MAGPTKYEKSPFLHPAAKYRSLVWLVRAYRGSEICGRVRQRLLGTRPRPNRVQSILHFMSSIVHGNGGPALPIPTWASRQRRLSSYEIVVREQIVAFPGIRAMWQLTRHSFGSDFVSFIDKLIAETSVDQKSVHRDWSELVAARRAAM